MKQILIIFCFLFSVSLYGQKPFNIVQSDNFLRVIDADGDIERELYLAHLGFRNRNTDNFELYDETYNFGKHIDDITNFATVTSLFDFIEPLRLQAQAMGANDTITIAVLADSDADTKIEVELNPDEDSIHITAEGVKVVTIDSSEINFLKDVSFGHSTPTATVDIGNAGTPATLRYRDGNQANGYVLTSDGSGNATWQASAGDEIIDGDSDTYVRVDTGSDSDTVSVATAGTERITVLPNGNVGVAKDNPTRTVDIDGNLFALDTMTGDSVVLLEVGDGNMFGQDGFVAASLNETSTEIASTTIEVNKAQLQWQDLSGGDKVSISASKPGTGLGYGGNFTQTLGGTNWSSGFTTAKAQSDHFVYRSDWDLDVTGVILDSTSINIKVHHDVDDGSNYNQSVIGISKDTITFNLGLQTGTPAQSGSQVLYQIDTAQFVARNYKFDVNQDLSGLDNYVLTYDSGDGEISLESVPASSGNYAGIYADSTVASLSLVTQDQWYQIVSFDTDMPETTSNGDHTQDHITVSGTGDYDINFSHSFSGSNSSTIEIAVFVNNGTTELEQVKTRRKLGTGGDVGSASGVGIASLTDGDTVELWARCIDGASKTITPEVVSLSIRKL